MSAPQSIPTQRQLEVDLELLIAEFERWWNEGDCTARLGGTWREVGAAEIQRRREERF